MILLSCDLLNLLTSCLLPFRFKGRVNTFAFTTPLLVLHFLLRDLVDFNLYMETNLQLYNKV